MSNKIENIRLGVTGGRGYENRLWVTKVLNEIHAEYKIDTLIEGGAGGLDSLAREWAVERNIPVETYCADWGKHGRAAGPIRNSEMAGLIDALAVFPGGPGTQNMRAQAIKRGVPIFDRTKYPIRDNDATRLQLKYLGEV